MRRSLIVVLALIVVLPLGLLAWLGARAVVDQRQRTEWSLRLVAEARLAAVDERIQGVLAGFEHELERVVRLDRTDPETLRGVVRTTPQIDHLFVVSAGGSLLFPPLGGALSRDEAAFLVGIRTILEQRLLTTVDSRNESSQRLEGSSEPGGERAGWYPWFWDSGLHLIYWRRDAAGRVVGVELDRVRLMSEVIAALPPSDDDRLALAAGERMALEDSNGDPIYRWGTWADSGADVVEVRRPLAAPLAAWTVVHGRPAAGAGASGGFFTAAGLAVVAVVLTGLAVFLYRESSRELREARHRVRFTNQVSHELRTPLTNIRLYAELLEQAIDDDDREARDKLGVIVSESRRLSRLIGNVLTFGRRQRGELELYPAAAAIDEVVAGVVEQFRPALAARGVELELALGAPAPTLFDRDAVEQVLGNLLSNVEKYAPRSGVATVSTSQAAGRTLVRVADRGPGIPAARRDDVFEPFVRLDDRLTEGVSGAGIGLAIARDLARLMGGELRLADSDGGACFELELRQAAAGGGERT